MRIRKLSGLDKTKSSTAEFWQTLAANDAMLKLSSITYADALKSSSCSQVRTPSQNCQLPGIGPSKLSHQSYPTGHKFFPHMCVVDPFQVRERALSQRARERRLGKIVEVHQRRNHFPPLSKQLKLQG